MSIFSRISKEAKILIGLTCLAGASLIWFNFFNQQRQGSSIISIGSTSSPLNSTRVINPNSTVQLPTASGEPTDITPEAITGTTEASEQASSDVEVAPVSGNEGTISSLDNETSTALAPDPEVQVSEDAAVTAIPDTPVVALEPSVAAVAESAPVIQAATEIDIAELPFLIVSPPLLVDPTLTPAATQNTANPLQANAQRASVNPFAPLVLTEVIAAPTPADSGLVEVAIPDRPQPIEVTVQDTIVESPPPVLTISPSTRALTAPSLSTTNSLRPLPSGSLPTTPSLLRQTLVTPLASTDSDVNAETGLSSEVASITRPSLESAPAVAAPTLSRTSLQNAAPVDIDSVTTSAAPTLLTAPLASLTAEEESLANRPDTSSTVVGTSALSRYLRDNNVRFTGSATGPVSVGVFRSALSDKPIVIPLGDTLPDTNFVLASLKGQEAAFKDEEEIKSLALDLWR